MLASATVLPSASVTIGGSSSKNCLMYSNFNVGKETLKFEYIKQFLDEEPPIVTDADGKTVAEASIEVLGLVHGPVEVSLAPGKEIVLESRIDGASAVRH